MTTLLGIRDLKTYFYTSDGVIKAVDGISYDVEDGETVALVGESGCGKSVSALSIMRLVPAPHGRIVGGRVLFKGEDLLQLKPRDMRRVRGRQIAMVFQDPMTSLNPVLSIKRQMTEGMELHLGLGTRESRKRALTSAPVAADDWALGSAYGSIAKRTSSSATPSPRRKCCAPTFLR